MCVPSARIWRLVIARLCSSASVPSAVARSSAPRCSIHSGVSGATSTPRPAPRPKAAASSSSSAGLSLEGRSTRLAPAAAAAGAADAAPACGVVAGAGCVVAGAGCVVAAAAVRGVAVGMTGCGGRRWRRDCRLTRLLGSDGAHDMPARLPRHHRAGRRRLARRLEGRQRGSGSERIGRSFQIEPSIQARALHSGRRHRLDGEFEAADAQAIAHQHGLFAAWVELRAVHPQGGAAADAAHPARRRRPRPGAHAGATPDAAGRPAPGRSRPSGRSSGLRAAREGPSHQVRRRRAVGSHAGRSRCVLISRRHATSRLAPGEHPCSE